MKKIKVLHIQKVGYIAGSENHLLTILPELSKHYCVEMLVLFDSRMYPSDFINRLQKIGIKVYELNISKFHIDLLLLLKITYFFYSHSYNIIHTHLIHADFYGTLAARLMIPQSIIISTCHGESPMYGRQYWNSLIRFCNNLINAKICVSFFLKDFLQKVEKLNPRKIHVIHHGYEQRKGFELPSKKIEIENHEILLGSLGRLIPEKSHDTLIKAIPNILKKFPDVRLLIMGDGELRSNLETLAKNLKLSDKISFLGYRQDIDTLLKCIKIFVHPSIKEGFGIVLLEAMAQKLPIVATQASAIPEIVQHNRTGLLVPINDPDALASAICHLLENPQLAQKMGEAGYGLWKSQFTVSAMVTKTIELYEDLLSR